MNSIKNITLKENVLRCCDKWVFDQIYFITCPRYSFVYLFSRSLQRRQQSCTFSYRRQFLRPKARNLIYNSFTSAWLDLRLLFNFIKQRVDKRALGPFKSITQLNSFTRLSVYFPTPKRLKREYNAAYYEFKDAELLYREKPLAYSAKRHVIQCYQLISMLVWLSAEESHQILWLIPQFAVLEILANLTNFY